MSEPSCSQAISLATARRAGLSDADALRLEQHVATCPDCAREIAMLDGIVDRLRAPAPTGAGRRALSRAMAGETPRFVPAAPGRRPSLVWGAGIALAAAAALVLVLTRPSAEPDSRPTGHATATAPTRVAVAHGVLDLETGTTISWSGAVVSLTAGRVEVGVDRAPHLPFRVETPSFVVVVTGTRFSVTLAAVEVVEGSVEVRALDGALLSTLHAGDRWELVEEDGVDGETVDGVTVAVTTTPATGLAVGDPTPPALEPRPRPRTTAIDTAPAREPSARERFAAAAALESSAPDDAALAYEAIERDGGPWAANALFARASLELQRGRRAVATALLERYLERHADGPNAADARDLLGRE